MTPKALMHSEVHLFTALDQLSNYFNVVVWSPWINLLEAPSKY